MAGREISDKKHGVKWSAEERERLEAMICAGKHPVQWQPLILNDSGG